MNLDVSVVHGQSDRSSSLKQPAEQPEKQEFEIVENMQTDLLEATIIEAGSKITEKSSISDDSGSKSKCGSLIPHNLEYDPEGVRTEPLEQKKDNGAEDKFSKSGAQESDLVLDELRAFSEDVTENFMWEHIGRLSDDLRVDPSLEYLGLQRESTADGATLDQLESGPVNNFENPTIEQLELSVMDTIENASFNVALGGKEPPGPLDKSDDFGLDVIENISVTVGVGDREPSLSLDQKEDLCLPPESQKMLGSSHHSGTEIPSTGLSDRTEKAAIGNINGSASGGEEIPSQSRKRKSTSTPPVTSTRVLRSRIKEKPETPETNNVAAESTDDRKKKKKMKKKRMGGTPVDEFSRIRSGLKYLLNRINCEQHFIDAYSGEGWKGQSLDKIKPESELRRAKSHILRYKLRIRDLFQRLDLLLAEGKLPESLFDSEGEIDSEDIFCAKCGSKDLPDNNDIILCDGACERGFHQFCLEPPLLKDDIPPDEEGWLCPGCDCKDDCLDLLNDSYGTKLSVVDSWEKVFPEEAAAASGKTLDDNSGFASDDSEDDDYDPDKPELDETKQRDELGSDEPGLDELGSDESSSNESDYFSASEGVAASPKTQQYLGLPSDESEDDEYDPDAPDDDEQVKQESSSSDFTSDSEDLGAFDDNTSLNEDQGQTSRDGGKLEVGRGKGQSLRAELSYLLDSNEAPVSEKRHVRRFDYKKLHDETYGNVSSDSSDEDFEESAGGQKRTKKSAKRSPISENGEYIQPEDSNNKEIEHTPKRASKKHKVDDSNNSLTVRRSSEAKSGNNSARKPYKKLGEVVSQRLSESFKENQYPQRPEKELLAKELGLTIQQISKWFENARWSYRHSATMGSRVSAGPSNRKAPDIEQKIVNKDESSNVVDKAASPEVKCQNADVVDLSTKPSGKTSGTPKSRKRKGKMVDQESVQNSSHEKTPKENSQSNTPQHQQVRRSSRLQSGK